MEWSVFIYKGKNCFAHLHGLRRSGVVPKGLLVDKRTIHLPRSTLAEDELADFVRYSATDSLVDHLPLHNLPILLVQLVHGRANAPEFVSRHTADVQDCIQQSPVVQFYHKVADRQTPKDLSDNAHNLRVANHPPVVASNVKVALVELSAPSEEFMLLVDVYWGVCVCVCVFVCVC